MDPVAASCSNLLAIQSTLVNRALDSLGEAQIWQRPGEHSNSIGWIVGHLTWARNALVQELGGEAEALPWGGVFERGAQVDDRAAYPATAEIVAGLKRVNQKLRAKMAEITEAELSAPSATPMPSPDKTVRGVMAFLTFHDGYHVGQIAYALKLLGKPGLVG
jgi:uncharacterized damage-inducible protein DinB